MAYGIVAGFGLKRRIKPTRPSVNEKLQKGEKSTEHSSTMNGQKFFKKLLAPHEKK